MRYKFIGHVASVDGAKAHGSDADETKEPDYEGAVEVRCACEKEGQGGPEAGECGAGKKACETCLDQDGMLGQHLHDAPEEFEVVEGSVGGGVVWHEEPEQDEDEVLKTECHPVYRTPGYEVGDCT